MLNKENLFNKKISYSFLFFFFTILFLVQTNYAYHFPNDGVKYFFDSEIILKKIDVFFSKNILDKPYNVFEDQVYSSNFFTFQSGIVSVIATFRFFLGDLWFLGYITLIALLNSYLFNELFKIKKIFNLKNISFILLLVLVYGNFEYIKVSKSYYNEAIYIPILNIFIIKFIDYCFSDKKIKFDYFVIFSFLVIGLFFRIQHLCIIFTLLLFYYFKKKSVTNFIVTLIFVFVFFILLIFYYYVSFFNTLEYINMANDLSIFFSFTNLNKFVDSSDVKFFIFFYIVLISLIAIFIYEISIKLKKSKKFFIFCLIYIISNLLFLFALPYNDERYYLTVYLLLSILFINFFDKKIAKNILNDNTNINILLIFALTVALFFQSYKIKTQYQNSKTFRSIKILKKNPYIYFENKNPKTFILCEIPRICSWVFYNNKEDISKIYKFENFSLPSFSKNYIYVGDEKLIKNLDYYIIEKENNIIIAELKYE